MKVSATELANDSKKVIDRVIKRGERADIQRHGKTIAQIEPQIGATREEVLELFKAIKFTNQESKELKKAMDAAADVFGGYGL